MSDYPTINHEIRAILKAEPGLTVNEILERVTQPAGYALVAKRLYDMMDNDYVVRDSGKRYSLTGKEPGRRMGSVPYKSRTRRDEQADAKEGAEAARLFREFQKTARRVTG